MITKSFSTLMAMFISMGLAAQHHTLDHILNNYYQAANLKKLTTVSTVIMTGTIVQQDLMPVTITRARPDKFLMVFDVADLTAYQGFDGQTGWWTMPWTGNAAPQKMPPDRTADLKVRADIDGILWQWKEKGHTVELAGTDTVDGRPAWKIKVTRNDGVVEYESIDREDYLLKKRAYTRMAGGKEIQVAITSRDFRPVEGIPFPFTVETNNGGRVNEIQFDEIKLNEKADEKIFEMPKK